MLWKELFIPRVPVFYRPLGLSIALVLAGLLAWGTTDFAIPAFRELWANGYGVAASGSARAALHAYLRIVGTGISLVVALGVASDAAAGITTEREKDTWISLISTPLSGMEIVRAKMLGAAWSTRHTAAVLVVLGLAGVLAGSLHPLGLLAVLLELAALTWFAAALGTWISLRSQDTTRAVARVMAGLVLVNGGSLLVTLPLLSFRPLAFVGCTPVLLAASLASYGDVLAQPAVSTLGSISDTGLSRLWFGHGTEMFVAVLANVLGYAAGAWALTRSAGRGFDAQLDRPPVMTSAVDEGDIGRRAPRPRYGFRRKDRRSPIRV